MNIYIYREREREREITLEYLGEQEKSNSRIYKKKNQADIGQILVF
jgi:hypothetical protein